MKLLIRLNLAFLLICSQGKEAFGAEGNNCTIRMLFKRIILLNRFDKILYQIFINFLFLDYYSGQQGGLCNDESDVIRSVSDCEEALKELGYSPLKNFWITSTDPIPAGCSIHVAHSNPHFLENTSGLGKRRQDLTPVCKENGNTINGMFWFI